MTDKVIYAKATAAGQSTAFYVEPGKPVTVYIYPSANLAADEYGDLQRKNPDGTWDDVFDSAGQVRLSSARTCITIEGEGEYRIDKDLSTAAFGVAAADVPG